MPGVSFTYTVSNSVANPATNVVGATVKRLVTLTDGLDLSTLSPSVTCTAANAYLLSGFVRFVLSNTGPDAASLSAGNAEGSYDTPLLLAATTTVTATTSALTPVNIDSTVTGKGPTSYVCYAQSQKVISASNQSPVAVNSAARSSNVVTITTSGNHGYAAGQRVSIAEVSDFTFNGSYYVETVPSSTTFTYTQEGATGSGTGGTAALIQRLTVEQSVSVSGYNSTVSKFIAYTCVVTPDSALSGDDFASWWGEAKLVTDGTWTIGTTSSTYKVCRFSGDYAADGAVSNHEHPRYYRRVKPSTDGSGTIDNQNYLVIKGSNNCPADVASDPVNGDLINTSTVQHQPVATPASDSLSFKCTSVNNSTNLCNNAGKTTIEPASAAASVPMF